MGRGGEVRSIGRRSMSARQPSHLLKLDRASTHLKELHEAADQWLNGDHHRYWVEGDRQGPFDSVMKVRADDVPADPFALLVGDVVQNLRNCLDHLAFHLAAKFSKPLSKKLAEESQFPIVGDEDRRGNRGCGRASFKGQARRIAGMDPKAAALIEGMQPYQRGAAFRSDPLWQLQELSNIDKHRVLHVVAAFSSGLKWVVRDPKNWPFAPEPLRVFAGTINQEAVVARFVMRTSREDVEMQVSPTVFLSIDDSASGERKDICEVLRGIHDHIVNSVVAPLEPYL